MMARGITLRHRDFLIANEQRQVMRRAWAAFFKDWDLFLCPAAASPAQPHAHRASAGNAPSRPTVTACDQMFWAGMSSLFLLPATVPPLGFSPAGLPFGVQIIGPQYGDLTTIAFARMLECAWQGFTPPPSYTVSLRGA